MMLKKMKDASDLDLTTPQQRALTEALQSTGPVGLMGLVLQGTHAFNVAAAAMMKLPPHVWQRIAYESDKIAKSENSPSMARFQAAMMLAYANFVVEMMAITTNFAMDDKLMAEAVEKLGPDMAKFVKQMRDSVDA